MQLHIDIQLLMYKAAAVGQYSYNMSYRPDYQISYKLLVDVLNEKVPVLHVRN